MLKWYKFHIPGYIYLIVVLLLLLLLSLFWIFWYWKIILDGTWINPRAYCSFFMQHGFYTISGRWDSWYNQFCHYYSPNVSVKAHSCTINIHIHIHIHKHIHTHIWTRKWKHKFSLRNTFKICVNRRTQLPIISSLFIVTKIWTVRVLGCLFRCFLLTLF